MGREIRRVPLSFDHPLHKVWPGFVYDGPDDEEAQEAWERTDPPAGEGWQIWETVSEGSPVSPVLPTAEALVEWMVNNGDGSRYVHNVSREAAEAFVRVGWVPSGLIQDGVLYATVEIAPFLGEP